MNLSEVVSLLSQKVQIGQLTMPVGMIIYLMLCSSIVAILNYKYLQKYNHLMAYIEKHYPDIYQEVRSKPDVAGIGYSKGYKRVTPLIKLSDRVNNFNDIKLSKLLFTFIKFDRSFMIFSSALILVMVVLGLAVGLYFYT